MNLKPEYMRLLVHSRVFFFRNDRSECDTTEANKELKKKKSNFTFYAAVVGAAAAQRTPAGCASWTGGDGPGGGGGMAEKPSTTVHDASHQHDHEAECDKQRSLKSSHILQVAHLKLQ